MMVITFAASAFLLLSALIITRRAPLLLPLQRISPPGRPISSFDESI